MLHWLFCRLEQYLQFLLTDDRFLVDGRGVCGHKMIVDGIVEPMELAHLPYRNGKTYEDYLGLRGLERMGKKKWRHYVARIVQDFQTALDADCVVLGG